MSHSAENTVKQTIASARLQEQYIQVQHPSGLTILLCPMKGFSTAYAMFTTKYGSVDTAFKTREEDEFFEIPDGTAHYLEHKMFESEDGDAFARFSKTGASANAFTSFDKTAYLFACSDRFEESLEILLDFVSHPYFTPENVAKEQGIIGQEIRMYEDSADWRVLFNLLEAMYLQHPVRIDVAGTIESISHITDEVLYRCYNTFYHPANMVLAVAGNFDADTALKVVDRVLPPAEPVNIIRKTVEEPSQVAKEYVEQNLPVATPLFAIGFKNKNYGMHQNFINMVVDEMLIDIVAGETTALYGELYRDGLINAGITGEVMAGRDYTCALFEGESRSPKRVYQRLLEEIQRIRQQGIDEELFQRTKKATYGRYIGMYTKPEAIASVMTNAHIAGMGLYDLLDVAAAVTKEQLQQRLQETWNSSALSVVRTQPEQED